MFILYARIDCNIFCFFVSNLIFTLVILCKRHRIKKIRSRYVKSFLTNGYSYKYGANLLLYYILLHCGILYYFI